MKTGPQLDKRAIARALAQLLNGSQLLFWIYIIHTCRNEKTATILLWIKFVVLLLFVLFTRKTEKNTTCSNMSMKLIWFLNTGNGKLRFCIRCGFVRARAIPFRFILELFPCWRYIWMATTSVGVWANPTQANAIRNKQDAKLKAEN